MSIKTASSPTTSGAPRRFGRRPIAAAIGAAVLIAGLLLAGVWASSRGDSPVATVQAPALAAPPAAGVSLSSTTSTAGGSHTMYLVSSNEQALAITLALNDSNAVRQTFGELPLVDSVVVVPSGDPGVTVVDAIGDGNRILAAMGLDPDVVVDLRGS